LYRPNSTGDARPEAVITKGVHGPNGLAFDVSGDLWVSNSASNTVVEYKKSELAKVSPAPSVIISWRPADELVGLTGLAFDSSGNLWADQENADAVTEYTKSELSVSGSPTPRVTITNARLFYALGPAGLAVDPSGNLWVEGSPSATADAVSEYPNAQLTEPGPPIPRATISPGYQLWDFTFVASGNLWVPNYNGSAVAEYAKAKLTKSGSPAAHITISEPVLDVPQDLAFDSSGDLWVINSHSKSGDPSLVEYTKAELAKSGSPTAASTIKGAATGLNNPNYLAIEP
jgi:secreted PhoX family phosphatase